MSDKNTKHKFERGTLRLLSRNCVNSNWPAYWLKKGQLDYCQCGFDCKVKVSLQRNGNEKHTYVVTESEYKKLIAENVLMTKTPLP